MERPTDTLERLRHEYRRLNELRLRTQDAIRRSEAVLQAAERTLTEARRCLLMREHRRTERTEAPERADRRDGEAR